MADIAAARRKVIERILDGDGRASKAARKAAFDNSGVADAMRPLVEKVAHQPSRIDDGDIAAAKASASEDEIFETVVCAAIGQASRQYESALAALAAAVKDRS